MKKYTVTDTAKIVKSYLKEQFPDTKFSVKTEKYSGGQNIKIMWTDGIARTKVQEVTRRFSRNNQFAQERLGDRSIDTWEGEQVIWGADIVKWEREITEDFKDFIGYIFDAGCCNEFLKEEWQLYFKAWEVYKDIDNNKKESWDYPRLKNDYIHQIIDQFSSDDFQGLAYYRDEDLDRISELDFTATITLDRSTKQAKWVLSDNSDGLVKGESYSLIRVTSFVCRIGGDRFRIIESDNQLQFNFESTPKDYTVGLLETRGFQGTGTIYQRELNTISTYAKDSILEALNCVN